MEPRIAMASPAAPIRPNAYIPDPPSDGDDRFARAFKPWREWYVAVEFLSNLHCGADESQVLCLVQDPPDVVYESARFEVKEILDQGRKRHDEVKLARRQEQVAPSKLQSFQYSPQDLTPEGVGQLILQELAHLQTKNRYAPEQREQLDLLFYVNKVEHWFEDGPVPKAFVFESFGWRSVSALIASHTSIVFAATPCAPIFLIENAGRIRQRWESLDE